MPEGVDSNTVPDATKQGEQPPAGGEGSGSSAPPAGGNGGGQAPPAGKTFDEAYVKTLREEAAKHRKELQDTRTRLKELEDKDLSESEKATKRLKELEEQNVELQKKARIADLTQAVATAGAISPGIVAKLIDPEEQDVSRAIAAVKKECPALFRAANGTANGGAGNGTKDLPGETMNDLIRRAAGRG